MCWFLAIFIALTILNFSFSQSLPDTRHAENLTRPLDNGSRESASLLRACVSRSRVFYEMLEISKKYFRIIHLLSVSHHSVVICMFINCEKFKCTYQFLLTRLVKFTKTYDKSNTLHSDK